MSMPKKDNIYAEGQVISTKEEWEKLEENWLERSIFDRLNAIEILRQQYIELFLKDKRIDFSFGGLRNSK